MSPLRSRINLMPLFDVGCPNNHKHEILLTPSERDAIVAEKGDVIVECTTCGEPATRLVSLPGSMRIQWARAARGQSV